MKHKVLIVEDEEPIAEAEKLILEDSYEVHHAADGDTGLEMANEIIPDIVLLDLMLPKRGGYELCFNLRQSEKFNKTKIIMVTAKNLDIDEDKGMLIGADDYITKPFEPEELLHVIQQVLKDVNTAK